MAPITAIDMCRSGERITERREAGSSVVVVVETVREAGDVGEHGGRATATGTQRVGSDVAVERGKGEAGEAIGVRRHACAWERTFWRSGD